MNKIRRPASLLLLVCLLAAFVLMPAEAGSAQQTLHVLVVGAGGEPLPGAQVEVHAEGIGLVSADRSGVDGRAALSPGAGNHGFVLRIWADGHALYERRWTPAGDGQALTAALTPLWGGLTGHVVDSRHRPVAGAAVSLWRAGGGAAGRVQTGADGFFALSDLQPGEYTVQVEAPTSAAYAAAVSIAAGRTAGLDAVLSEALGYVAGTVVASPSGLPLDGARVELVRQGWGVVAAATTAGGGGRFSLRAAPLDSAAYYLRVTAAGHAVAQSELFALPSGGRQEFSGERRLQAEPLYGAVWGVVLQPDGTPVSDAAVELQLRDAGTVAQLTTDADGFFAFDQVLPGAYRVRAFPGRDRSATDSAWLSVQAGEQYGVRLNPVAYLRQDHGFGIIAGFVSAGGTAPVADAVVTLLRGHEVIATTTSDAWGRYRFTQVPGSVGTQRGQEITSTGYVVRVAAAGFLPTDQPTGGPLGEVAVRPEELTEINFALYADRITVTGRVLDDGGSPVEGAEVRLYREGHSAPVAAAETGVGGHFSFATQASVGPARFYVTAAHSDYLPAEPSAPLQSAATPAGRVEVNPLVRSVATRLQGRVTDSNGAGVSGAAVRVLRPSDGRTWEATSGDGGRYEVPDLPGGPGETFFVRAQAAGMGGAALAQPLTPGSQPAALAHLTLAPPAALAGVVTDGSGQAIAGARVQLRREGSARVTATAVTDALGRYRFADLTPGDRYAVTAVADGFIAAALAPGSGEMVGPVTAMAGQTARADLRLLPRR